MKQCLKCLKEYESIQDNFHKDKTREDGYHVYCKTCRRKSNVEHWRFKNPRSKNYCVDCGIDISDRDSQAIRCIGCKNIRRKAMRKKKYDERKNDPDFIAKRRLAHMKWRKNNHAKYKSYLKKYSEKRKAKNLVDKITK